MAAIVAAVGLPVLPDWQSEDNGERSESHRDDVRDLLAKYGWKEDDGGCMVKNGALWTEINDYLDSGLDSPGKLYNVPFDSRVPASVIVAACLAAAAGDRGTPGTAAEPDGSIWT